jgi:hypothetical protein
MFFTEKKEPSENNEGTGNVTVGKYKPKNVKWSPENEMIMVEWCDIAQCYKWLHMRCHSKFAYRHAWFTIPAIALSTISGTASFAQTSLPQDAQAYAPMAIGTINIFIGISTTIQQYLKISELNEAHRISGISWDKFARNIRIELAKDPDERMDAGQFLKICRAEFDRLMETSPSIDSKTIKEFHVAFQGKETAEDRKRFAELQQERFRELRKPDICNIIISSNESRHQWFTDPERLRNFTHEEETENVNTLGSVVNSSSPKQLTELNLSGLEKMKQQRKEEKKEPYDSEKTNNEDTKLLDEYVAAFVAALGRKPLADEITLNMKENVDKRSMEKYLSDYNSEDLMPV